ncbi:MAG TPA: hypothetical protein VFI75_00035 [Candidatus Acidoferrum sp.]|nr:hypothetical protein [Candidatus Acidoferrum sp.]
MSYKTTCACIWLLCTSAIVGILTALFDAAARSQFFNLLHRSWNALMQASSSSTFGFVLTSLGIPLVSGLLALLYFRFYKRREWRESLSDSVPQALLVLGAVALVMCGAYIRMLSLTVYRDHQWQEARRQELEVRIPKLNNEMAMLKEKLGEICFMPDRKLTEHQRDKLYASLKATAQKYHQPHFRMGYFDGDTESMRYAGIIAPILHDAGFVPGRDIVRRPRAGGNDPADFGFREGLSIQSDADAPPSNPRVQQIVQEILQGFANAKVEIQPYPVGSLWPLKKKADEIVIWVGYKKVDWLSLSR